MIRTAIRSIQALLVVATLFAVVIAPVYAQGTIRLKREAVQTVDLFMQEGWESHGIHSAVNDFVIDCPNGDQMLKDPDHPCNQYNNGRAVIKVGNIDSLVLVCPTGDQYLKDPDHPCNARKSQILNAGIDDLVLVCPTGDQTLPDPNHPCNQTNGASAKFEIPDKYVLTCPIADQVLLPPNHPCNRR